MPVRPARLSDVPAVKALGREAFAESGQGLEGMGFKHTVAGEHVCGVVSRKVSSDLYLVRLEGSREFTLMSISALRHCRFYERDSYGRFVE